MERTGIAFFAERPRTAEDLCQPHAIKQEQTFEIVKTILLSGIDYENFITDMRADRQFIEDNAAPCAQGDVWKCIFVRQKGRESGILVMPTDRCFVGWAAYLRDPDVSSAGRG